MSKPRSMSKPRMFSRGDKYESIEDFIADYRDYDSSRYTYWHTKLMHINFVAAMCLGSLMIAVDNGVLYRAIRNITENNKEESTK